MEIDYISELKTALIGCKCNVERSPCWSLTFVDGPTIKFPFPWRIIADRKVAFASEDDGQWFGLKSPLDDELCANELLSNRSVQSVEIDWEIGDICILFGNNIQVQAFNSSSGYEGWRAYYAAASGRREIIMFGGGDFAVVDH